MAKTAKHKTIGAIAGVVPLAIALVYNALVPGSPAPSGAVMNAAVMCEGDISDAEACHSQYPSGCSAGKPTKVPYDFTLNVMKNEVKWVSEQPSQWRTSLSEFQTLENSLPSGLQPKNHGDYVDPLKQLGEGKIEGVVGYLYGAKPEGSETSNCGLPDTPNHEDVDFHIYIGFDPAVAATLRKSRNGSLTSAERAQISAHALHSTAVIVEMTPHYRESFHPGWTIDELNAVVGDQVRVVGQLMVDNEHYQAGQDCAVDPSKPACWRATVWEIHPVIDFRYCAKGNNDGCAQNSPADWTDVADAPSAPNASTANTKGAKGQPKSAKSDQPLRLSPGYQRQVTGTP
jgi:hypothetical protein